MVQEGLEDATGVTRLDEVFKVVVLYQFTRMYPCDNDDFALALVDHLQCYGGVVPYLE